MDSLYKLKGLVDSTLFLNNTDFTKLMKHAVSQVEKEFEDWRTRSITWSILDFAERARQLKGDNWKEIYDEDLFQEELESMIDGHDANNGINWDTVDAYLDNCKK